MYSKSKTITLSTVFGESIQSTEHSEIFDTTKVVCATHYVLTDYIIQG